MFERPTTGERAILVHVDFDADRQARRRNGSDAAAQEHADVDEFADLARAAGAELVGWIRTRRERPAPRYFLGKGKAEELLEQVLATEAQLVIFDHDLSPAQERNLEKLLSARVLSRTGLILDIFAQRARTHEGKLQVELAQLEHMSTRLVRGWSHLDRQKGGIGLRGAGETQLELDQRMIGGRIKAIGARLETVRRRRAQSRRARQRNDVPLIALVGYTNTGKSTLFNAMASAGVLAADQLFATLDPTLRRVEIPGFGRAVIADTVGFVRRLPHDLVAAFKATLEEVVEADLLLHVLDASDPEMADKAAEVQAVLAEIDALDVPQLEIMNKIDVSDDPLPAVTRDDAGRPRQVRVSALTGAGLDLAADAIGAVLGEAVRVRAVLGPEQGRLRARFYSSGWVEAEETDECGNLELALCLPLERARRLAADGLDLAPMDARAQGLLAAADGPP
ncbi:MAG: GTPase HflX [Gammaproteobacteria bacterium]|nr:MAG: GTPase HflX [Gammaproteobacteria bacterium]